MRELSKLPDGWRIIRLEQIAEERRIRADSAPQADVFSVTKHDGFVRSLEYFDRQVFSRDTSNYKLVRRGDLAYATIHLDEGSLGILRDADAGIISPMYTVFAVDKTQVDPDFLFALMKLPQMVARYGRIGEGTVHRRKSISFKRLGRLTFAVPPVEEQRRTLAVLDAIDEAIERTEAVISATERLRDALLHELLTRGVPGWHTQWRTVPGLGSIPADWQVVRLKEILVLDQPGAWGDEPTLDDPGVCVLRAADLTRDGHVVPDGAARRRLSKRDRLRRLMRDGDLMLERSGGGPGTPVGRVALIDGLGTIYCNNFCQHLRVDASRCNPDYAVRVLWHRYLRGITGRLEHRTTGIRNLDYAGYLAFPLPLPSLDEQDTIAKVLDRADGMHVQARAERDRLRALKASVTVVLLTGRVRVGQEQLCGLAFQS